MRAASVVAAKGNHDVFRTSVILVTLKILTVHLLDFTLMIECSHKGNYCNDTIVVEMIVARSFGHCVMEDTW